MKYLIIPDTHGRTFWKKVIDAHPIENYDKVIFLGDYLDPYPFEKISVDDAIKNFQEIIDFKEKNNDKVILLLGNHDIYYYYHLIGSSRYAYSHRQEIEMMFEDYRELFQIAFEGEKTLFTHSGYLNSWAEYIKKFTSDKNRFDKEIIIEPNSESLNGLLKMGEDGINILGMVSRERGGRFPSGSCIWADVHEHQWNDDYQGKFQIFGHTLQLNLMEYYNSGKESDISDGNPWIEEGSNFAMLDCRHGFEYNEDKKEFIMFANEETEFNAVWKFGN